MKYLLGSHFWGMNVEGSDKDYLQFVLPSKQDLFNGVFTSKQAEDDAGNDINIKDVRLILKELRKGSLRIFEMLYSEPIQCDNAMYSEEDNKKLQCILEYAHEYRNELFNELRIEFMRAVVGESKSRIKQLEKTFDGKQLAHFQKLYWLLYSTYYYQNPFKFINTKLNQNYLKSIRLNPTQEKCKQLKELFEQIERLDFGQAEAKVYLPKLEEFMIKTILG